MSAQISNGVIAIPLQGANQIMVKRSNGSIVSLAAHIKTPASTTITGILRGSGNHVTKNTGNELVLLAEHVRQFYAETNDYGVGDNWIYGANTPFVKDSAGAFASLVDIQWNIED